MSVQPYSERGLRPLLRDCKAGPEDQKEDLIAPFKAVKTDRIKKGPKRVTELLPNSAQQNSVTLPGPFCGKLPNFLLADIGANANLADMSLIDRI